MDPALQAKLLKVLEEKKVRRLGGSRDIPFDVRIVAAGKPRSLRSSSGRGACGRICTTAWG